MTLGEIEKLAKDYADQRTVLEARIRDAEDEIAAVKKKFLPLIKYAAEGAKTREEKLRNAIAEAPHLFEKPRTMTLHGIKIGFQKGRGGLDWDNDEQVVKLIRKLLPDQVDLLVKTKETPIKSALGQLTVAELKKLGVTVGEGDDEVVIKSIASEIEKLVCKWLEDTAELKDAA